MSAILCSSFSAARVLDSLFENLGGPPMRPSFVGFVLGSLFAFGCATPATQGNPGSGGSSNSGSGGSSNSGSGGSSNSGNGGSSSSGNGGSSSSGNGGSSS